VDLGQALLYNQIEMAGQRNGNSTIGGGLLSAYFMEEGVRHDESWESLPDSNVAAFAETVRTCLGKVPASGRLREAETEALIIFPILSALGWFHLPQQQAAKRRDDVPDALLFLDAETQHHALGMQAGMGRWRQAAVADRRQQGAQAQRLVLHAAGAGAAYP
jgi:hypothetical protein